MWIVAPCLASLSLFSRFRREDDLPEAYARTLVWFGAAILLITEFLSLLHALRLLPVVFLWLVVAAIAQIRLPERDAAVAQWIRRELLLLLALVPIFGLIAAAGALSPPNTTDAMGYHLPRVIYWAQAGSVSFFPVHYLPQLTQPPFAEYAILQTYLLSGGDHLAYLAQYVAFCGCTLAAFLIARALGAGIRGQVFAAICCATLPNGILQASGVKNDAVLALWVALAVYFSMMWIRDGRRKDLWALALAVALACATKGTAYLFLPPLLFATLALSPRRALIALSAAICAAAILNGPQYARNVMLCGRPLGPDSAQADGVNRWLPDRIDAGTAVSNILRVSSEHLAARSDRWNNAVRDTVVAWQKNLGLDPNDPATTWQGETYQAPRNSNHEANAGNRWQLLLLLLIPIPLIWSRDRRKLLLYAGLIGAYLLFCTCLRWQPFLIRMQLSLFVTGMGLVGSVVEIALPYYLQIGIALLLLNSSRPYLLENWVRPLKGPHALYRSDRDQNYFNDMTRYGNAGDYRTAAALTIASRCRAVGIDNSSFHLEYPYQALLLERDRQIRFIHTGVANRSAAFASVPPITPCAVLCLNCADKASKRTLYASFGEPAQLGEFLLYLKK